MAEGSKFSAQEWATVVSTLVDLATAQQDRCDELLNQLSAAINRLQNMPTDIARQTASEVVKGVAKPVALSVENVLRPVEERAQDILRSMDAARHAMDTSAASYKREVRRTTGYCIALACVSAGLTTVLVVLALKFLHFF